MFNSEMEQVIGKLVSVTELLATEVAALVDDLANRGTNADAPGINARAQEIRQAALQLRITFDEFN
jgi:hypothetical protein